MKEGRVNNKERRKERKECIKERKMSRKGGRNRRHVGIKEGGRGGRSRHQGSKEGNANIRVHVKKGRKEGNI